MFERHTQSIRTSRLARQRKMRQDALDGAPYDSPRGAVEVRVPNKVKAGVTEVKVSPVARALKRCRGLAGLSHAGMAKVLGMSTTGYQHYENRYKKPRFERDLLEKLVGIFRNQGVPEEELAKLGDLSEATIGSLAEVVKELRLVRKEVAALREQLRKPTNAT